MITHDEVIKELYDKVVFSNIPLTIEYTKQQKKKEKLLELYQKFVHDLDVTLENGVDDDCVEVVEYEYINIGWSKGDLVETFKEIKKLEGEIWVK